MKNSEVIIFQPPGKCAVWLLRVIICRLSSYHLYESIAGGPLEIWYKVPCQLYFSLAFESGECISGSVPGLGGSLGKKKLTWYPGKTGIVIGWFMSSDNWSIACFGQSCAPPKGSGL